MLRHFMRIANNGWHLLGLLLASFVVASLGFAAIESVSLLDGFYWASTTMTTVGYGDISPVTTAGKIGTIVFQLWSIFVLVPMVVAFTIDNLHCDDDELTNNEWEWNEDSIQRIADHLGVELAEPPANTNHEGLL